MDQPHTNESSPEVRYPKGAIRRYRDIVRLVKKAQAGEHVTLFKVKRLTNKIYMQKHHLTEKIALSPNEIQDEVQTMLALYNLDGVQSSSKWQKNFLFTNYFFAYGYLQKLLQERENA